MVLDESDELLDLIDAKNNAIGTVMRESYHARPEEYVARGEYWRGVACFLVNDQHLVWIPRRQPWRRVAPGGLDFSMAEHVKSGETHIQGAIRGMQEELNLAVEESDMEDLLEILVNEIGSLMKIYLYHTNETPDFNKDDYQSAQWLSLADLELALQKPGEKMKSVLPEGLSALKNKLE